MPCSTSYTTGKGFLVSDDAVSRHIDILIYESQAPMLYRDGEFMIVQARFVKGVIEVKTKNGIDKFRKTTKTLCEGTRFRWLAPNFFRGIFLYDFPSCSLRKALTVLQETCHEFNTFISHDLRSALIYAVCCGPDNFIKYHVSDPRGDYGKFYDKWHGYRKKDRSFGWFIASVVEAVNDYDPNFDKALWGLSEIEEYKVAVMDNISLHPRKG